MPDQQFMLENRVFLESTKPDRDLNKLQCWWTFPRLVASVIKIQAGAVWDLTGLDCAPELSWGDSLHKFTLINGRKNTAVHKQFMGMLKAAIEESQAARLHQHLQTDAECFLLCRLLRQAWSAGRNAPSGSSSSCKNLLLDDEDTRNERTCCGLLIYGLTNGLGWSAVC